MNKFLETFDHQKLNLENIIHKIKCITSNEIEAAIESPKKEKPRT
jgi:predicted type IV restriction endonuclease